MMACYVGIDAGGTGTRVAVWEYPNGPWQYSMDGPPASLSSVSVEEVYRTVSGEALKLLGKRAPATVVGVGVAGCVSEEDRRGIAEHLVQAGVARRATVHHDAFTAWMGATAPSLDGIIVIAGTGSSIFGRKGEGMEVLVGGYGWRFGDEGSGSDLGRAALRAAAAEEDGFGPVSTLRSRILGYLGRTSMRQVMVDARDRDADWLAEFAPLLLAAVTAGDVVAYQILTDRLNGLVEQIATAMRRVSEEPSAHIPVYGAGGLFSSPVYGEAIHRVGVGRLGPTFHIGQAKRHPWQGALLSALAADGISLAAAVRSGPMEATACTPE